MSDTPQGPGWWLASDGKWYPPSATTQVSLQQVASARGEGQTDQRAAAAVRQFGQAKRRSLTIAVWVTAALAVIVFVILLGLDRRSSDGRSVAERELGIKSASGDSAYPPQRDLIVPLDLCGRDGGALVAGGQLVNHTSEPASYYVVTLFRSEGKTLAARTVRVDGVPPGGVATFRASVPGPADVPERFKCRVTRVERWSANAPAPAEPTR
ncbi:MAG: hypothetical protein N2037_11225 [Acidimicrobiales bacterium]|nr:hypothetical protein [Acidimicrobiales bacterium]